MRLITLNIWGGRRHSDLLTFIKAKKDTIDVFCLQEVYKEARGKEQIYKTDSLNILTDIEAILTDFVCYFRPHISDFYGLATFVRKGIKVLEEGEQFVYKDRGWMPDDGVGGNHARNVQYVRLPGDLYLYNFHGLWNGKGKSDTPDRLEQSRRVRAFIESHDAHAVLCGDFNLELDTESIKILEEAGLRNLIREHGITSTRTALYAKPIRLADYIFTTQGIKVSDFQVLPDTVSDHSPLFLDFEVV